MDFNGCPRTLYKYCGPDRVDFFPNGTLRFSPLDAFNDPFEGRAVVKGWGTDDVLNETVLSSIPQALQETWDELPNEIKSKISFEQLSSFAPLMQTNVVERLKANRALAVQVPQRFLSTLGVLCLSEEPENLLMWAHYGVSHSGFLIRFNAHHPYFHAKKSDRDDLRHLRRVLYRSKRPAGHLTELQSFELFDVKSEHWHYEKEWRMLLPLSDAKTVIRNAAGDVHLFELPAEAVESIVLGARCKPETEAAIRTSLAAEKFAHVKLQRAVPDPDHFILRIEDV